MSYKIVLILFFNEGLHNPKYPATNGATQLVPPTTIGDPLKYICHPDNGSALNEISGIFLRVFKLFCICFNAFN